LESLLHWLLQQRCKSDHSTANNVIQQNGLFSMPGKRKEYSNNFWVQVGAKGGGGGIAQCGHSLISTIALCCYCSLIHVLTPFLQEAGGGQRQYETSG